MNRCLIVLTFFFGITGFMFSQPKESSYDALLILEAKSIDEMNLSIKEIENNDGRIIHRYPPDILIGKFPGDLLNRLKSWYGIKQVITSVTDETQYPYISQAGMYALQAWNNNFMGMSKSKGLDEPPGPDITPLSNCIIMETPVEEVPNLPARSNAPEGAAFEDVSEFLLGSISVAVILTESDGTIDPSTEDWSAAREAQCVSEIQNGFNWLANQNPDANLSFSYHFYYGRTNPDAQTQYEPIIHNPGFDFNWQNEILSKFGYSGDRLTKHYSFLNDLIESDDTNWGAVIWLVDSYNDDDGRFADGTIAYTGWIGWPYSVMSYKNGPWGISNMDLVTVHEFQHQFYAHDEYIGAIWYTNCTARAGYLNVENQNFQNNCLLNETTCTMRSAGFPISSSTTCFYTHGHDGWYDDDSDGIPNILDTNPITNLDPVPPGIIYQKLLPGNVDINPLPNQNPLGNGNNITLNTAGVESRFDGLYWFDGIILNSNNDFVVGPFPDGVHTVEVRATNSVGNIDPTPETFSAEFQTHFKSLSTTALTHNGGRKVWTTPYWNGETGAGYRVVYEDNGDIYYTEYRSGPFNYYWTDEILLSDGSGNNKNPAITSTVDYEYVCVVWQQYDPALDRHHIKYREYNYGWLPPVTLSTTTTASDPQPVVGGTQWPFPPPTNPYYWHFVWNNGNGLKYALAQQDNIFYVVDIQGTDANCHNPTITDNHWFLPATIGIAWDKTGHVYYQEVEFSSPSDPYNPVGSPVDLSCGIAGSQTPSISQALYNGNIMMLTWSANYEFESCNEEKGRIPTEAVGNKIIVARRKDGNGYWGIPRYIQYGSKYNNVVPSVGAKTQYFNVLWEVQGQNKVARLDYVEGQGWQSNGQA